MNPAAVIEDHAESMALEHSADYTARVFLAWAMGISDRVAETGVPYMKATNDAILAGHTRVIQRWHAAHPTTA